MEQLHNIRYGNLVLGGEPNPIIEPVVDNLYVDTPHSKYSFGIPGVSETPIDNAIGNYIGDVIYHDEFYEEGDYERAHKQGVEFAKGLGLSPYVPKYYHDDEGNLQKRFHPFPDLTEDIGDTYAMLYKLITTGGNFLDYHLGDDSYINHLLMEEGLLSKIAKGAEAMTKKGKEKYEKAGDEIDFAITNPFTGEQGETLFTLDKDNPFSRFLMLWE